MWHIMSLIRIKSFHDFAWNRYILSTCHYPLYLLHGRRMKFQYHFLHHLSSVISQFRKKNLGRVLMATPQLRSFKFHSHFDVDSGGRPGRSHLYYYDCKILDESLAQVMETSKKLVLFVQFSSLQSDVTLGDFQGMNNKMQSLQHFKKLRESV